MASISLKNSLSERVFAIKIWIIDEKYVSLHPNICNHIY